MHIKVRKSLAAALLSCGIIATCPLPALANLLDEIQVQPDNFSNVVRVRFNGRIHVERQTKVGKANVVLVYFKVLEGTELQLNTVESLRSKPVDLIPGVTVSLGPQPNQQTRTLELRFDKGVKPVKTTVQPGQDGKSLDIIFGESGKAQSSLDLRRYAITLLSAPSKVEIGGKVIPQAYQDYDVFTSQQTSDGAVSYELNLGYFASAAEAEKTRKKLLTQFPNASVVDLAKRRKETLSKVAEKEKPQPSLAQAQKAATQAAVPEVENQAASLMPKAKDALNTGNYELAINTFNQILLLPPNDSSQEAQELVGLARERFGELDKAKAEYELYLKLFPEGPGADRVRQQLAGLSKIAIHQAERRVVAAEEPVIKTVSGSVSQTYYGGKSLTETPFDTTALPGSNKISTTDQSELRTNINLYGRYRDENADQKLSFEDDNVRSFIDTRPNRNRVYSLNYEYKGLQNGFTTRIGRQSGSNLGGVPNRFDGLMLGYSFSRKIKTNLVIGAPVDFPSLKPDQKFLGVNLNAPNIASNWGFTAFAFDQRVDGIQDREAVGGDLFYSFKPENNISTHIDYDTSYGELNIGTIQGYFITSGRTSFNFSLDRRRTPFLTTTDALYNQAVTATPPAPITIKELLLTKTEDQIRQLALSATAVAYMGTFGFTTPLIDKWQVGNDFSWSKTGALPGQTLDDGTIIPPTAPSGNVYTYSIKGIGTNLFTSSDINVFSLSLNKSNTVHGFTLLYNNSTDWNHWTFKPVLQFQRQYIDTDNSNKTTWSPDFTVSYRIRDYLSLETEYTFEHTVTTSSTGKETTQHHFFTVGYRWDF
jgi:tetratricopeptide (TPR) repeat protein